MNSWPKTIYVCDACDFTAMEPVEHMHQYPRIPVPGFHKHTAEMMLPFEVVPRLGQHVTGVRLMQSSLSEGEILPDTLTPAIEGNCPYCGEAHEIEVVHTSYGTVTTCPAVPHGRIITVTAAALLNELLESSHVTVTGLGVDGWLALPTSPYSSGSDPSDPAHLPHPAHPAHECQPPHPARRPPRG